MRNCLLALALVLCVFTARGQRPFTRDLWLNEAGTPVKVNAIIQDNIGYHWLATDAGLFRFNGRSFSFIPDSIYKPVTALAIVGNEIYAGYATGEIVAIKDNGVKKISIKNERPSSVITSMHSGSGAILWVCTEEEGIFAIMNGVGLKCNTDDGLSDNFVYEVSEMPGGRLLAGTDKGINEVSLRDGKVQVRVYTSSQGLPDNIVRVLKPIHGTTYYWCGTQQGGLTLFCSKTSQVINLHTDTTWKWGQVNDILPVGEKRAWVVTEDGYVLEVFLKDHQRLEIKPLHLEGKRIKSLLLGRSGIIWIATSMGLSTMTAEYMRYIPLKEGYHLNNLLAMACDKDDIIWLAEGDKLYSCDPKKDSAGLKFIHQLPANITCLYPDDEGRLWIGTFGRGLWYNGVDKKLIEVKDIPPLISETVLSITGTHDKLWVAGLNGVEEIFYPGPYTRKMELLKQHNKRSGIGSDYVYQLFADRKQRIWMATDGAGVCMYDGGSYQRWDSASGMKSDVVYSVVEDAAANMWAATLYDGLYYYNNRQWHLMQTQGVQDVNISTLAANATGQVIVVNTKGIDVWYPHSGLFRNYPKRSFDIDSISTELNLSARDKEGNVYIPFEDGLIQFKNIDTSFDIRPTVNITSLSVFFKPVSLETKDLAHGQNHITFRFEGVNFANPEKLHYRYKLEGYNDGWVITSDEAVTFPQLPDGTYKMRIQASLNSSFNNAGEASYSFSISKPFWKRSWFIILAIAALSCIVYLYIRIREQNLRKLSLLQSERMMFEYEHLKSQVNPHFLFNSLNTLSSLIDENPDAAMNYTSHLSDLYRNMLAYRDRDLVMLWEEFEILNNYLFIQKSRFGKALRMHMDVPEDIMRSKKIIPLALQLLVENAIKHNAASVSRPLDITITATGDTITVRNTLQPKISKEKGAGLGLINIRNRYSLLSKKQITFGIRNNEYIVTLPLL